MGLLFLKLQNKWTVQYVTFYLLWWDRRTFSRIMLEQLFFSHPTPDHATKVTWIWLNFCSRQVLGKGEENFDIWIYILFTHTSPVSWNFDITSSETVFKTSISHITDVVLSHCTLYIPLEARSMRSSSTLSFISLNSSSMSGVPHIPLKDSVSFLLLTLTEQPTWGLGHEQEPK